MRVTSSAVLIGRLRLSLIVCICSVVGSQAAWAEPGSKAPTAEAALQLRPIQQGVEYDKPARDELKTCTIKAEQTKQSTGWVVRDGSGQMLRRFEDTNGDKLVDRWSYFRNGLEVYRDVDTDYDGKADECRWFHTAGTRWGVDRDENGKVDQWKRISAEEVAEEAVLAIQAGDAERFQRLLVTSGDLKALGITGERLKEIEQHVAQAGQKFAGIAKSQKKIDQQTTFVDFEASRPGVVPAGTTGVTKELLVYENASAIIQNGKQTDQIMVGTLVRVGDTWKLMDLPSLDATASPIGGHFFFTNRTPESAALPPEATGGPSSEEQKLLAELEKLDRQLNQSQGKARVAINEQRMTTLGKLANASRDAQQRVLWIRQLADTASAEFQAGGLPSGLKILTSLEKQLADRKADRNLLSHVVYRRLGAAYAHQLSQPKVDYAKVQQQWIEDLEGFIKEYPGSDDTAEATLQLGMASEFAGDDDAAVKWYRQAANSNNETTAKKAAGAARRITSEGKPLSLTGKDIRGRAFDIGSLRGKVVLIQYWATWCEPCKADIARLRELHEKFGRQGFEIVSISLDTDAKALSSYLGSKRMPWMHLFEEGGFESRLATELGVLTLPTMLLVDQDGNVASRSIHVAQLNDELERLLDK